MEKEFLEKELQKGLSINQIARNLDCSVSRIRYYVLKYKLKSIYRIQTWTDEEMKNAIENNFSISDVLRQLNLKVRPGNYVTVNKFAKNNNISLSHMLGNSKFAHKGGTKKKELNEVLVENSDYSRHGLKKRLVNDKILENKCDICGQLPEWKDKNLIMILDHINGINNDNRLENLRLLCPNCNSQTDTYCGRKNKKKTRMNKEETILFLQRQGIEKGFKNRKVKNRPTLEVLETQIKEIGFVGTGKIYGVTDNTIRKWIKFYNTCKSLNLDPLNNVTSA